LNGSDARYHDDHQEDQDDQECLQECLPSRGIFLVVSLNLPTNSFSFSFFVTHSGGPKGPSKGAHRALYVAGGHKPSAGARIKPV